LRDFGPFDCAVEVGPHPALKGPATQTMKAVGGGSAIPYVGVLDRSRDDTHAFADFLGFMWERYGPHSVDLASYVAASARPSLRPTLPGPDDAPTYAWDHSQAHLRQSRVSRQYHFRTHAPHELLGVRTRDDADAVELRWRNVLHLDRLPWLSGHRFQG